MTPQPSTFEERFIDAFEEVVEMRSDFRHMGKAISSLQTGLAELRDEVRDDVTGLRAEMADFKTDMTREMADFKTDMATDMADLKTDMTRDMAAMESRLLQALNAQTWKTFAIFVPFTAMFVGLASYFAKVLG